MPIDQVLTEEPEQVLDPLFSPAKSESGDDFFGQLGSQGDAPQSKPGSPAKVDDVAAKWQAALADDEFLDDDEGLLPSDDEGFLPSDDEGPPVPPPNVPTEGYFGAAPQTQSQPPASSRYTPQPQQQQQWQPPPQPGTPNMYAPQQNQYQPAPIQQSQTGYFQPPPSTSPYSQFGTQQPHPAPKKPQSYVDKKEGYQSPYDLPMDINPPLRRKGSNLAPVQPQHGPPPGVTPSPPLRNSSLGGLLSPPIPGGVPPQGTLKPKPPQQKQQFFEELPMAPPKPRSTSAMGRYAPIPGQDPMNAPPMARTNSLGPQALPPRPGNTQGLYSSPQMPYAQPTFAQSPQQSPQQSFAQPNQYTPAPAQMMARQGSVPGGVAFVPPPAIMPTSNRYSPAVPQAPTYAPPPSGTSSGGYTPTPPAPAGVPLQAQVSPLPTQSKYAPRPGGPPQASRPPSGTYALPPAQQIPAQTHGYASPPPQQDGEVSPTLVQSRPVLHDGYRRNSGEHHVMHSSRPGTAAGPSSALEAPKEEEEEEGAVVQSNGHMKSDRHQSMPPPPATMNKYAPPHTRSTSTPPPRALYSPPANAAQAQLSPKKGILLPRSGSPDLYTFQPPPRAQTGSPGSLHGRPKIAQKPRDPYERPSSALAHSTLANHYPESRATSGVPLPANFIAPDDVTGKDELQRWQGAPVFTWGFGGAVVSMFPKRTQRYTSDLQAQTKCSPGEVKVRALSEIYPLAEEATKFPGPMWTGSKSANKSKKKEAATYMDSRIEAFEKSLMDIYDPTERREAEELCMLWKVVKIMVDNDGAVEGTPEINAAVRKILVPEAAEAAEGETDSGFVTMAGMTSMQPANAETVDSDAVQVFRKKLLTGEREAAVWFAVDKRMWAHAFLISGTVGPDLWKRVVQEFVKNEVKTLGEGSASLAVLYETLAGNWEESVDELVPPSARMGMPMLSTAQDKEMSVEERLGKWRETLALILSNRSPGDQASILALGRLLAGYGWIGAAHICYVFARQSPLGGAGALFAGADDQTSDFTLLGVDLRTRTGNAKNHDSIILSEIYEFAVSLSPHAGTAQPIFPHLQIWKLHYAMILAENGHKAGAQKYCDAVAAAVKAWNKPSPYFHQVFGSALEDLTKRLQEAPRDASSASGSKWIPKLTSDAVSTSMWGAFNKFVSGDEAGNDAGLKNDGEGPFASISRSQSGVDLYGAYSGTSPTASRAPSMSYNPGASNRYAPSTAARSSMDSVRPSIYEPQQRNSSEMYRPSNGNSYEPSVGGGNPYEPQVPSSPYGAPGANSYESSQPNSAGFASGPYAPRHSLESTPEVSEKAPALGYTPYEQSSAPQQFNGNSYEPQNDAGGYQPPDTGYTPYQPEPDSDEDKPKPKPKKSFMDDDDDDKLFQQAEKVKKAEEERKRKEEEKKQQEQNAGKKGWFGGWFGRGTTPEPGTPGAPIKAKLGEESTFVYDPDLKRWVNKKAGESAAPAPKPQGPPKRTASPSPSITSTATVPRAAPPRMMTPDPPMASSVPTTTTLGSGLAPPSMGPPRGLSPSPGPGMRSVSTGSAPPPPKTGGDAMDELLGPPMPRKGTPAGRRKKGGANRYVEVIPGQQ
ncbi:Sec23-binding domain of Sec16-domain-containing protein [Geopyxis carbonaria]|nr:Sec23-binding domain of Sec16-domain-containing protein [Geopyxis carbonaria]